MTKKTTRTRTEAKKLMWEYYSENKSSLPTWIREFREEILEELMDGMDVGQTFESIIDIETPIGEIGASVSTIESSANDSQEARDAA